MNVLDDIVKKFTVYRREQVTLTNTRVHVFEGMQSTQEEYDTWILQTREIKEYANTLETCLANNTVDEFVSYFKNLQNARIETLVAKVQIRIQFRDEEDAVEGLMLLRKRGLQMKAKEEKKKAKEEKKRNPPPPPPRRSSARIADKNMENIKKNCRGCIEDQPNQMAHMGPHGCLGDEW